MCGIAGSFSFDPQVNVDVDALQRIATAMRMRGPDGEGAWQHDSGTIALVHRRLAVIDLSDAAAQPMQDVTGQYVISYNGEIYNYPELRAQCQALGYEFATQSDTEVLLALYQFYGTDMLGKLRGMFALAICDVSQQTVLLARDPYGIKPLYYVDQIVNEVEQCVFASSLRALQAANILDSNHLDRKAVASFHHTGSIAEPLTWFQQARMLPAGSYRVLNRDAERSEAGHIHSYWNLSSCFTKPVHHHATDYSVLIRQAVVGSVQAHMVADVPVGLFLSAGIDSSVLAALMRECTEQPIQAITLRFDEYQGTLDDESILAADTARRYGFEHHVYTLTQDEFLQDLPQFFAAMEQPTIDALNTWFIAKVASQLGLKVAISGIGGDELFGGYPSFQNIPRLQRLSPLLKRLFQQPSLRSLYDYSLKVAGLSQSKWSFLPNSIDTLIQAYRLQRGIFMPAELNQAMQTALTELEQTLDMTSQTPDNLSVARKITLLESQCYLRNQLLRDTDWAGMAHSIEIRTPLVDSQLTATLSAIPDTILYAKNKSALARLLPEVDYQRLSQRSKTGFTLPMQKWLAEFESANTLAANHWSKSYVSQVVTQFSRA